MPLFQSNLRKQIRKLPKILQFVKIIHYYSELFTSLLRRERRKRKPGGGTAARRVPRAAGLAGSPERGFEFLLQPARDSTDPRPLGPTGGGQRRGQRHSDLRRVGPRAKARIAAPPSSFSAAHFSSAARQSVASAKEDVAFARLTVNVGSLDVHELHFS